MIGRTKPFSKELHRRNDPKSRQIVKDYLKKNGIIIEDNKNRFGVDLISADNTLQVEVEHRLSWKGDEFPFDDVNIPERKGKFFKDGKVQYFILSKDYSHLGIIDGKTLKPFIDDAYLKESSNKHMRHNEFFFKIPKDKFKWVKL